MSRPQINTSSTVALAFHAGAQTYDRYATIQQHTAATLEERIAAFVPADDIRRVVDLGCGTGSFTRALSQRYPGAAFVGCDLAQAMVDKTRASLQRSVPKEDLRRFSILCADAEFATFAPAPDLVTSNLAMQWFPDPLGSLAHHARRSRYLAWTTLIEGTFASWIAAHELRNLSHGLRHFLDAASIVTTCERLSPLRMQCNIDYVTEAFPNAIEFLRSLKSLGAATARAGHEPAPLQRILRSFDHGFTAEYRVCTILLEMPQAA